MRGRPAPLAGDRKGLSQASHNKLHLNNSAAMRGLIALALPPTPPLLFQLGGSLTCLRRGARIEDHPVHLYPGFCLGQVPQDSLVPESLGPHWSEDHLLGSAVPAKPLSRPPAREDRQRDQDQTKGRAGSGGGGPTCRNQLPQCLTAQRMWAVWL